MKKSQMLKIKNVFLKRKYRRSLKRMLAFLLVIAVSMTGPGMENFAPDVQAASAYTTLYLADDTAEHWIGNDNALIELVDNTYGHDHYVMTRVNDTTRSVRVPASTYNVTFNRIDPSGNTQWNSWSAGGRDGHNTYHAQGHEYGYWDGMEDSETEIIKVYDTDSDFAEGSMQGLSGQNGGLKLESMEYAAEPVVKTFNQEAVEGITAVETVEPDTAGTGHTVHYNIALEGKAQGRPEVGDVDSYFRYYEGNLYAFINTPMYWKDAKEFCEACGGHLATVSSEGENTQLKEMASEKGSGYTALGFSDEETEGDWKWITGEPDRYTNWRSGEPNNAYGTGQDHAYMYENGEWDDGYDRIISPFFCEWEMVENPLLPVGRDIELVVEVNGSVEETEQWECQKQEDGSTVMVHFLESMIPGEKTELDMDITLPEGEGYRSVIKDSYYLYYDRKGKGHRIEMGDLWLPVPDSAWSGTWNVIFDSGQERTDWGKLCWEAVQAGNSCVTAHIKAYDQAGKTTEADAANGQELQGIRGRYAEIEMTLQAGQDYRSPVLEKVVLESAQVSESVEMTATVLEAELLGQGVMTQGSRITEYFKLSGGLETVPSDVEWTLVSEKGDKAEDYEIIETKPYLAQLTIEKAGIYFLRGRLRYGEEECYAEKKITVKKAPEMADMESIEGEGQVNLMLELPDYGKAGETIHGGIHLAGSKILQSVRVLQDGEEISVLEDGTFEAVLPAQEGKSTFDILAEIEGGGKIQKKKEVIVDDTPPVITITPERESYVSGDSGRFHLEIKDASPIHAVSVRCDGTELHYQWNYEIETGILLGGEHIIEVTASDLAGNEASGQYTFRVEEGGNHGGETPDEFGIRLDRSSAGIGDTVTVQAVIPDHIDPSTLTVMAGETAISMENNCGIFIPEAAGTYTFVAAAEDGEGKTYRAEAVCMVYDTTDKTAPRIQITSPEPEAVLTDVTEITGSVTDDKALDCYTVEYAQEGTDDYTLLVKENEERKDTVLGKLDTTMLCNGNYIIKVTAKDKGGNSSEIKIKVTVEGDLKVGAMQIGFTDITAKMGGATVSANRMYDSRNKKQGDFGYGWSLGMQGMELSESHSLGDGYQMVKSGSLLSTAYQMTETVSHDVVVTYGDGTSDRFELTFTPERKALVPISEVTLGYRCVTNQKVKLEIIGNTTAMVSGGELFFEDESMYDAVSYKLTTEEGNELYIRKESGVYKIVDANGNVITVDKDGYHGEDGKSITFTRDGENRIVKAEDPAGNMISYGYDAAGDLVSVTDAADRRVSFAYDKQHNLVSITDPMGIAVARNEYDGEGRLTATVDADGNRIEYDYDVEGRTQLVTDRLGNKTLYVYDDSGNVLSTTDANGKTTKATYDSYGNVLTKTDAKGNVTAYAYDTSGNMTTVTDADGNTLKNTYNGNNQVTSMNALGDTEILIDYDEKGNLTATTDAEGNETEYSYDRQGNVTGITDELGKVMSAKYDKEGNVIESTDSAGNKITSTYDESGNRLTQTTYVVTENGTEERTTHYVYNTAGELVQTVDADGNTTSVERNANGKMSAAVDSKGRRTEYEYDRHGNVTKITYSDGTTETFEYDAEDRNTKTVGRTGLATTYSYDKVGNLLKQTDARGNTVSYTYDSNYNLLTTTNAEGAVTSYAHDKLNRNTSITDAEGNVTSFTYNGLSLQTSTTDAKGNVTKYEYDGNGNRTGVIYPDGSRHETGYDERGRIIWQKDAEGRKTEYTYDGSDRLTTVEQPNGAVTSYTYDQKGNLTAVEDANGNATRYEYDAEGRRTKTILADGSYSTSSYDKQGMLTGTVDYNGVKTTYTYDDQGRILKEQTGSEYTAYEYDTYGRLAGLKTKNSEITYRYNRYGELEQKTYENGEVVKYLYDPYGRTCEIQVLTNDTVQASTKYEYDKMSRLTRVIGRNGEATVYTYDANGNRETATFANGVKLTYTYDDLNRLILQKSVDKNGTVIAQYAYTLGKNGERTKVIESGACGSVETSYDYDKANRLVKEVIETGTGKTVYEYSYDQTGNRTCKEIDGVKTLYTYDSRNRLVTETTQGSVTTCHYDANGNLLRQSGGTDTIYTYDVYNRLTAYQQGGKKESYTYDAEGVRRSKTTETDSIYFVSDTRGDLSQTLAETDSEGNVKAEYARADILTAQVRAGEVSYYLYDGHGDVRALLNEAGRITDKYRYNAYGELLEKEGDTENHYLYTGEYYDGTSNLYYLRARYMNPSTGTFISMDTYAGSIYDPDTLHKYLYANGNPVTYSDPSGNMFDSLALGVSQQAEESKLNQVTFNIGMTLLKKAWAIVNVQNVMSISLSYKITEVLCDYFISVDKDKSYNLNMVVTDVIPNIVWPWEKKKEDEKATAIDIAKEEEEEGNVYYHATSVEKAALIVATGSLVGSIHEGGFVYAWRICPNRKALRLSGARDAKVIIRFTTKASFINDWGIDNPYVKAFGPVKSYFPGPVSIKNPVIIPVM